MLRQRSTAALIALAALSGFAVATAREPKAASGEKQIANSIGRKLLSGPQTMNAGSATLGGDSSILNDAEAARLRELGSGVRDDLRERDFALVEKALSARSIQDQQWAALAIEKFCHTRSYTRSVPGLARAASLAQTHLNQEYVDRNFSRLLNFADAKDSDLREFASRAMGALASNTTLLTTEQIAKSCDRAVAGLRSGDADDRRRGVNLLGDLMGRLDAKNARQRQAVDQLLDIAEDWQRSCHSNWDEWQRDLSAQGTAKQRFQAQALQALMHNSGSIVDNAQVMRTYQFLSTGIANRTLDFQAVPSIAALASRLPAAQRRNAVQLAIEGISDKRCWHDVGSGRAILKNYAADALSRLVPCLDKDERQRAIEAIDSQRWNREQLKVFAPVKAALQERGKKEGKKVPGKKGASHVPATKSGVNG